MTGTRKAKIINHSLDTTLPQIPDLIYHQCNKSRYDDSTTSLLTTDLTTVVVEEERKYLKPDSRRTQLANRHPFRRTPRKLLVSARSSASGLIVLAAITCSTHRRQSIGSEIQKNWCTKHKKPPSLETNARSLATSSVTEEY